MTCVHPNFNLKLNMNLTMATHRKRLPIEIWTHIISLVDSQATLATSCSVSRDFKDIAAPKLYEHIVLQIDERLETLFNGLARDSQPHTMFRQQARTVKCIDFQTEWTAFGDNHGFWIILRVADTLAKRQVYLSIWAASNGVFQSLINFTPSPSKTYCFTMPCGKHSISYRDGRSHAYST